MILQNAANCATDTAIQSRRGDTDTKKTKYLEVHYDAMPLYHRLLITAQADDLGSGSMLTLLKPIYGLLRTECKSTEPLNFERVHAEQYVENGQARLALMLLASHPNQGIVKELCGKLRNHKQREVLETLDLEPGYKANYEAKIVAQDLPELLMDLLACVHAHGASLTSLRGSRYLGSDAPQGDMALAILRFALYSTQSGHRKLEKAIRAAAGDKARVAVDSQPENDRNPLLDAFLHDLYEGAGYEYGASKI